MAVYAVCLNPLLASPIAFASLDAAVSLVETGRWQITHGALYGDMDVALAGTTKVLGPPPGLALVLVPVYVLWRAAAGAVQTLAGFQAFHAFATLTIGAAASALAAGEVAALAGWLGASRRGQCWAALLFALGTPAFLFATRLYKENLAALLVIAAVRLAVVPGEAGRRALAGALAGAAGLVAYPAGLIGPALALLVGAREGVGRLTAVVLGGLAPAVALVLYNTALFGRPWRFAYGTYLNLPGGVPHTEMRLPRARVLLDSLVHQREGLLLYSPFLLLAILGFALAWRAGKRGAVVVTVAFTLALWLLSAGWLAPYPGSFSGARYLFASVPLLAAFAGPALEHLSARLRWLAGIGSVGMTYLAVQAGHIADPAALAYAVKTFVSGWGLPVLFKETLPAWLGLETLHTAVSRPDVSAHDVLISLASSSGWRLVLGQTVVLLLAAAVFGTMALLIRRLWTPPPAALIAAPAR
ncbi:MAG TPA: hypothetical protein VFW70_06040 [Methylomirabilota bacterium]|nr:hypothetical protein [Methylomirabilota bacterium]